MAKVDVYNLDGAVIGQIELSDAVFGIEPNQSVMHQVVKKPIGKSPSRHRIHQDQK